MNAPKPQRLRHREDCTIDRQDPVYPAAAVLYDCDGEVVRTFDQSWTDAQIWAALDFANQAYATGYRCGQADKTREVRRVLDIPDLPQTA